VRVFVTVDIEGIAGVVHGAECEPGNAEYERARRLMTEEANAVVAGIYDADPAARVTVADVHGPYRNMLPEQLDERAISSRGKPKLYGMVDGLDDGYDQAMFIGVHGRAGTGTGVLSHTLTSQILGISVNGEPFGELGLNAAMAGAWGVPVTLVAGDQAAAREARELLGSDVVTVEVKQSRAHQAAESLHPAVARAKLREGAARAVRVQAPVRPLLLETPITVEVGFTSPVYADLAELIEDVERVTGNTIRYTRLDMPRVYRVLRLITVLCSTPL
jgi:D-amino peptidase